MITHVLVPIDDTELSTRAVPVAGALARMTGATVDLLTVDPLGCDQGLDARRLDHVADLVPPGVGLSKRIVATTESVADALAHLDHPTGTIMCIAAHGRGALASLGLGSVTANLVTRARMPVLVIGPRCASEDPSDLAGTVLAAVDGTPRDESVVRAAVQWARATGSPMVATTTVTRPSEPQAWSDANDILAEVRSAAASQGVDADVLPVAAADVDEGLLRAIEPGTGCVVMGSHHRGRLGRLLYGSTTASVVHRAPCPVLVAAPTTDEGAAPLAAPAAELVDGG
jgi:nucleotide-binding universal stress UspA family protein